MKTSLPFQEAHTIHRCRPDAVAMAAVLRSCEGKQQLQLLEMLQDEAQPARPGMGDGEGCWGLEKYGFWERILLTLGGYEMFACFLFRDVSSCKCVSVNSFFCLIQSRWLGHVGSLFILNLKSTH